MADVIDVTRTLVLTAVRFLSKTHPEGAPHG
jgi:hypothetical protein